MVPLRTLPDVSGNRKSKKYLCISSSISPLPVMSDIVRNGNVGMLGHENMVFAFGILLASGVQAEIYVPPV